jgi:hypothetical protein
LLLRLDRLGRALCVVGALHQALEVRPHRFSEFGQRRRCGRAAKQRTAHLPLEPLDGVGQRRLRDAAMPGGGCEISVAAKSEKISDVAHLHGCAPPANSPAFGYGVAEVTTRTKIRK